MASIEIEYNEEAQKEEFKKAAFTPRPYQVELLDKAIDRDLIVYLSTGSGKTHIAVMLLKQFGDQITRAYPSDPQAKRSVFLANTVPLVKQQADYLAKFTPYRVGAYYGDRKIDDRNVDLWDLAIWTRELQTNEVFVMSPQVFVDCLDKNFIELSRINLIIFDECHHATGKHPYSQAIEKCQSYGIKDELRVLGLTASIVQKKCNLEKFKKHVVELESKFNCKIETASIMYEEDSFEKQSRFNLNKPKIAMVVYHLGSERNLNIYSMIVGLKEKMRDLDDCFRAQLKANIDEQASLEELGENSNHSIVFFNNPINPYKMLKNDLSNLESHLIELGIWSFKKAYEEFMQRWMKIDIDSFAIGGRGSDDANDWSNLLRHLDDIRSTYMESLLPKADEDDMEKILKYSSNKLCTLVDWLREKAVDQDGQESKKAFHAIVFVERKSTAFYLNLVLTRLGEKYPFLKSDFVHGDSKTVGGSMNSTKQDNVLEKFRLNKINILIATNIVEEGIDVPACNLIIRFNKITNFGSFIQSKGRARYSDSTYVIMVDKEDQVDYEKSISDFIQIENEMEQKFLRERENEDETITDIELKELNRMIPPLSKGKAQITCINAISFINRYCSLLESDVCGPLFPLYHDRKVIVDNQQYFECSLRLPPNSVFNEKITSRIFKRKKWAKMDAALEMCRVLDEKGEFTENLTILQHNDWLKSHCSFKESESDSVTKKKIGSTKNKREYRFKFADELENNHPRCGQFAYLYEIRIDELSTSDSDQIISKPMKLGYLSSKYFEQVPEFKLYKNKSQFRVNIKCINEKIGLTEDQINVLQAFNRCLIVDILKMAESVNFDENICGGYFVIVNEQLDIDWIYLTKTIDVSNKTVNEIVKSSEPLAGMLVRRCYGGGLMKIKSICHDLAPSSKCPMSDYVSFADFFEKKWSLTTHDLAQPLVETDNLESVGFSFLLKSDQVKTSQKNKKSTSYRQLFIGEHLKVVPFDEPELASLHLIPNIFHRLNSLLRTKKFQTLVETELVSRLGYQKVSKRSPSGWDESIRFNKANNTSRQTDVDENSNQTTEINNNNVDDDEEKPVLLIVDGVKGMKVDSLIPSSQPPSLIFKEAATISDDGTLNFPNVYNLLQCFTLKTASDAFDLERYEILGDCFLKLVVVLKIYADFSTTQEGKMVKLKSMRVSNRYLFELANAKRLHEYIISENCSQKENNLGPWTTSTSTCLSVKMADKSLADCVEALIGCYLICLGADAAKAFITWLDYVVSDANGPADFLRPLELKLTPIAKPDNELMLANRYKHFEADLGYKFNNKLYLYQAFTHPSDIKNTQTSSYQKLELVGDAVLDILITQYIFSDPKEHSPGELTDLRSALVNNNFFGNLTVKHRFHVHLNHNSEAVQKILNEFVKKYEKYSPDLAYLEAESELDELEIEPPKFLADIFESVAGAIYLDSNCSLSTVWSAYYKYFEPYLESFKKNLPQSPIKLLTQIKPNAKLELDTQLVELDDGVKYYEATLRVDGDEFVGKGESRTLAKKGAFKRAVRAFQTPDSPKYIFF